MPGNLFCLFLSPPILISFLLNVIFVVKHTHRVVKIDLDTNIEIIRQEMVWNYTIEDITLLAFRTSFPQLSLATIDVIRNIGNLYARGLGPRTLMGSAAFDTFIDNFKA